MAKDLSYYMNLPYNMIMERAEDGGWMGYLLELKGCTAEAGTGMPKKDDDPKKFF